MLLVAVKTRIAMALRATLFVRDQAQIVLPPLNYKEHLKNISITVVLYDTVEFIAYVSNVRTGWETTGIIKRLRRLSS